MKKLEIWNFLGCGPIIIILLPIFFNLSLCSESYDLNPSPKILKGDRFGRKGHFWGLGLTLRVLGSKWLPKIIVDTDNLAIFWPDSQKLFYFVVVTDIHIDRQTNRSTDRWTDGQTHILNTPDPKGKIYFLYFFMSGDEKLRNLQNFYHLT